MTARMMPATATWVRGKAAAPNRPYKHRLKLTIARYGHLFCSLADESGTLPDLRQGHQSRVFRATHHLPRPGQQPPHDQTWNLGCSKLPQEEAQSNRSKQRFELQSEGTNYITIYTSIFSILSVRTADLTLAGEQRLSSDRRSRFSEVFGSRAFEPEAKARLPC